MGDIYIAAHLRRCLRHSVFGHVLQYTPSTSVLDALHLHHAIKSPPLCYPSPLHIAFIEVKNELVKTKNVFPMKVITHTITYTAKFAGGYSHSIMYPANFAARQIGSIMYPANFAGGRSRLGLLLPALLPSREEKNKQDRKNHPLGCRAQKHTPPKHLGRDEQRVGEGRRCHREGDAIWQDNFRRTRNEKTKMKALRTSPYRGPTTFQERFSPLKYLKYPFCNACPSWANVEMLMQNLAQLGQAPKKSAGHLPNLGKG